jgi:hypothetical protein
MRIASNQHNSPHSPSTAPPAPAATPPLDPHRIHHWPQVLLHPLPFPWTPHPWSPASTWSWSPVSMAQPFFDLSCTSPPEDDDQNQHAGQSCKTCISSDKQNKEFSTNICKIRNTAHLAKMLKYSGVLCAFHMYATGCDNWCSLAGSRWTFTPSS